MVHDIIIVDVTVHEEGTQLKGILCSGSSSYWMCHQLAPWWKSGLPPPCTEQALHGADISQHANLVCMQSCMLIPECVLQGTSCMRSTCGSPDPEGHGEEAELGG